LRFAIHREGIPFIALFAVVNFLAFLMAPLLGWLLLPLTIWCIAFFRDPDRQTPQAPGLVISPADGKLLPIVEASPPPELGLGEAPRTRLSIFMNVFNVHVNRNPVSGTVVALAYRPGKFFNASFDKASIHNERMAIRVRPEGESRPEQDLVVVQIAGLVARRIVCELAQGQQVQRGARFGMIRFGSRLDVYLPAGAQAKVVAGSTIVAGETVLAELTTGAA
jgi:phosphatidylserine decarboxylase